MRRSSFIAVLAASVLGCIPFPHLERESPPVSGVIEADGAPRAGAAVRLVVGDQERACSEFWRETRTDELGRFSFPENRRFVPFALLAMAHTFYAWSVCLEVDGGFVPAIRLKEYTLAGVPGAGPTNEVTVTCDVTGPLAGQSAECLAPRYTFDAPMAGCSCQASRTGPTSALKELVLPFWAGPDVQSSGAVISLREHHACSGTVAYARITKISLDDSEMLVPERVVEFDLAGEVVREWAAPVEPRVFGVSGEELWIRNPDLQGKTDYLAIRPDGAFRAFDGELEASAVVLQCPPLRDFGESAYLRCWLHRDRSSGQERRLAYQGPCT